MNTDFNPILTMHKNKQIEQQVPQMCCNTFTFLEGISRMYDSDTQECVECKVNSIQTIFHEQVRTRQPKWPLEQV